MALRILKPERTAPVLGVLFDVDGVILDSEKLYTRFWREACAYYGITMSFQQSLDLRSLNRQLAEQCLKNWFGAETDYLQIRAKRTELMNAYLADHEIEPKPGVEALLEQLRIRGIPAAITTASSPEQTRAKLEPTGLLGQFSRICCATQVAKGKPEPDIYLYGASCLGVPPENCLALEDSYTGLLSANRAGCMNVLIPDLDAPNERTLDIAYAVADDLRDIAAILDNRKDS